MKTIILLLFIIICECGFSQDWDPFVKDQKSYFKLEYDNSINVEAFKIDSFFVNGDCEHQYFNSKWSLNNICDSNISKQIYNFDWLMNSNMIDSIVKIGDSVLFIKEVDSEIDTFILKPYCRLYESWTSNGLLFKCTEMKYQDILGNNDFTKVITCTGTKYDTIEIVLSKSYGLIKFLPFNEIMDLSGRELLPYFELIGFQNNTQTKGYSQPEFSDYFKLKEGDKLFWRDYSESFENNSTSYHVDSITKVFISNDSVKYNYNQISYKENGDVSYSGNDSIIYLKADEGKIVSNNTSWFGFKYGSNKPHELFFLKSLQIKIENNDTITYAEYLLPGLFIDSGNCQIRLTADYDMTVGFSTREGKIFEGTYSWGESSSTLIGSNINGLQFGDANIPSQIETTDNHEFSIFPNPFKDYITIKSQNDMVHNVELYDLMGNMLVNTKCKSKLYLGGLGRGIYFLRITDSNNNLRQIKIIK